MSSVIQISSGVTALWWVENGPFLLLWPVAYTTACTTVQAMINMRPPAELDIALMYAQASKDKQQMLIISTEKASYIEKIEVSCRCYYFKKDTSYPPGFTCLLFSWT